MHSSSCEQEWSVFEECHASCMSKTMCYSRSKLAHINSYQYHFTKQPILMVVIWLKPKSNLKRCCLLVHVNDIQRNSFCTVCDPSEILNLFFIHNDTTRPWHIPSKGHMKVKYIIRCVNIYSFEPLELTFCRVLI